MNKIMMKMAGVLFMFLWTPQTNAKEWTIPVTPNGTQGGYVETIDGKSQKMSCILPHGPKVAMSLCCTYIFPLALSR